MMTARKKRKQLEARGWSELRIAQYMSDWRYIIKPSRHPKGVGKGSGPAPVEGRQ